MNLSSVFTSSFFIRCIFIVALFGLIFISGTSYKHATALTESSQLLEHSYKIHLELEQLVSFINEAEAGQRAYILTHDTIFIQPDREANKKINHSFSTLKDLLSESVTQQENLDSLHNLIALRFSFLENSLDKSLNQNPDKAILNANLLKGKGLLDRIQTQIHAIYELESSQLKKQQKKYSYEISFTPILTLLLSFFSLSVLIPAYFWINNYLEKLKVANETLQIATETSNHAEQIGNFSSWQWDLKTNRLIYSDNQYRLLGCEPQSFEPNIEKFLEFVHPDDKHIITEGGKQVLDQNHPSTAFYRIIRKDGQQRYIKSIGKLLTDDKGKKILIGINSDVTEQYLNSLSLEERNFELEQINKELASFNHIASHDLQEPLRKIQTYISRISDKEIAGLSPTTRDYFSKIDVSASRMRTLIDDLLLFSRTNKNEKAFVKTDLDELLENAQQELGQAIEEKNAVISAVDLPVVNIIPFQIQQLFMNLIGNSLKYSRAGVTPEISINFEKVNGKDYPTFKLNASKKYNKIAVTDNGVGFEQQYAEDIFILFNRLPHSTQYSGTGIGLSICKKIAENHNGVIIAEGKPGVGSTFTFFLPE